MIVEKLDSKILLRALSGCSDELKAVKEAYSNLVSLTVKKIAAVKALEIELELKNSVIKELVKKLKTLEIYQGWGKN